MYLKEMCSSFEFKKNPIVTKFKVNNPNYQCYKNIINFDIDIHVLIITKKYTTEKKLWNKENLDFFISIFSLNIHL